MGEKMKVKKKIYEDEAIAVQISETIFYYLEKSTEPTVIISQLFNIVAWKIGSELGYMELGHIDPITLKAMVKDLENEGFKVKMLW